MHVEKKNRSSSKLQRGYRVGGFCPSSGPSHFGSANGRTRPGTFFCNVKNKLPNQWFSLRISFSENTILGSIFQKNIFSPSSTTVWSIGASLMSKARICCNLQYMRASHSTKCCNLQYILAFEIRKSCLPYSLFFIAPPQSGETQRNTADDE